MQDLIIPVLVAAGCLLVVCLAEFTRLVSRGVLQGHGRFSKYLSKIPSRYLLVITAILWSAGILLIFAVGLHVLPGGESWQLSPPVRLGIAQVDWIWRVKLFNALLGIGLIILFYKPKSITLQGVATLVAVCTTVFLLALIVGAWQNTWRWDPKIPSVWPWCCLLMLSFTAIPEEAFFRYCIQAPLYQCVGGLSLFITALLFGFAHFSGGFIYAAVAALAGLGYAYIWHRFQDVLLCSICHWLVNMLHFSLLTYPY
ncbi:MAG TPA: CPBP family intramembrane metalloprotease [Cellvibrionaceae bacterium]|nr:CPBP family intramembrane metalloprotease [Cellvibrionaceae bacterium]